MVFSPEKLDACIARAETINKLKSKHDMTVPQLIAYQDELAERLSHIENLDSEKERLQSQLASCSEELSSACDSLTEVRKRAAAKLEDLITSELSQLNFSDAKFSISFGKSESFTAEGNDVVEFLISTNRGEPLKPPQQDSLRR